MAVSPDSIKNMKQGVMSRHLLHAHPRLEMLPVCTVSRGRDAHVQTILKVILSPDKWPHESFGLSAEEVMEHLLSHRIAPDCTRDSVDKVCIPQLLHILANVMRTFRRFL